MMAGRRHRFGGFAESENGGPESFGRQFRLRRMLRGTDLRLVVLLLIAETPRHGYDLIKAIEEKSADAYSPSPGVIYPALTYLEEAGYAAAELDGTKKVYAITDAGRSHLEANRAEAEAALETLVMAGKRAEELRAHLADRDWREDRTGRRDRDIPSVLPEVNAARRALKTAIATAASGDEETQKRLAEILERTAAEIDALDIDI
jgi:DNA-binding PadR family transcriptional regulator